MTEIKSTDIQLVDIETLKPHPENCHNHSDEQIERLCELINYQGFRNPLIVQKGTNLIVAGHGRLMAAKKLDLKTVPVSYQEFENEAQLYAYIVSDNAIGKDTWASLDLDLINEKTKNFDDFNIDLLGIKKFEMGSVEDVNDKDYILDEEKFLIIIECADELNQSDLFDEFQKRELNCKLMS